MRAMAYNDGMAETGGEVKSGAQASQPIRILLRRLPPGRFMPLLFTLPFLLRIGYELFYLSLATTGRIVSSAFEVDYSSASVVIPLGLLAIALAALMYGLLRNYHRSIPQRIERSGVLEKLAQGPGGLPDVSDYAVFPLNLVAKSRRVSFKQQVFDFVLNLNWYLNENPKAMAHLSG